MDNHRHRQNPFYRRVKKSDAVLKCDICSEEIYPFELVHNIDGKIICPDCFFDFTFDYFSDRLFLASELRGNTYDTY